MESDKGRTCRKWVEMNGYWEVIKMSIIELLDGKDKFKMRKWMKLRLGKMEVFLCIFSLIRALSLCLLCISSYEREKYLYGLKMMSCN